MNLTYQIMPFKTEEKRKEIIYKLLTQGGLKLHLRDENLLKYRGEKTVDPNNSLEREFNDELNHPYFRGYKECVEFYLNPVDVAAGRPLYAEAIMEINWGSISSYVKGQMGGAQLFIALNLGGCIYNTLLDWSLTAFDVPVLLFGEVASTISPVKPPPLLLEPLLPWFSRLFLPSPGLLFGRFLLFLFGFSALCCC